MDGFIHDMVRGPDGKIYVAGSFHRVGGASRRHLVRLIETPVGLELDASWHPALPDATAIATRLAVSATHAYASLQLEADNQIAEISLTDGAIERSLSTAYGMSFVDGLSVSNDATQLIVAGFSTDNQSRPRPFQRINLSTGLPDPDWRPNITGSGLGQVAVDDGLGHWLLGGSFLLQGAVEHRNIARVSAAASAAVDDSFAVSTTGVVWGLRFLSDSRLLVNGNFNQIGPQFLRSGLAIVTSSGAVEPWNAGSPSAVVGVLAAVETDSARIVASGARDGVARLSWLDAESGADVSPSPPPTIESPGSFYHAGQAGSLVALSGGIDRVLGQPSQGMVLLDRNSGVVSLPVLGEASDRFGPATPTDNAVIAVSSGDGRANKLVRVSLDTGTIDPAWESLTVGTGISQLLYDAVRDHVYVVGQFSRVLNGNTYNNIFRVHASGAGGIDESWRPVDFQAPGTSVPLLIHEDHAYAVGLSATSLVRIALGGSGGVDETWNPVLPDNTQAWAFGVDKELDEIVVAGKRGGGQTLRLIRVSTLDGESQTLFEHPNVSVSQVMDSVAVGDHGIVYVAAPFGRGLASLLRFQDYGQTLDESWDSGPIGSVEQLVALQDGSVIAAGGFHTAGGLERAGIVGYGPASMIHRDDFGDPCGSIP
jgi:hypothetical protein